MGGQEERKPRNVYILLTDTGTLFTKLIKSFTGAPYNHASLALDLDLHRAYSFGRKSLSNPLAAGFVEEDIYGGIFRRHPDTRCVLLRLSATEEQYKHAGTVLEGFGRAGERCKYNLIGLLGIALNIRIEPRDRYFCSQFVAEALERSGFGLFEKPPALVAPHDFLLHPGLDKIFEGPLYEYPFLDRERLPDSAAEAGHAILMATESG